MTELAPVPAAPVKRVAFLGTPAMAVPVLDAIAAAGIEVVHVITRADKRRGRGSELMPSPVKVRAAELGIPVSHRVDDLLDPQLRKSIDVGVVVAYGALIKPHVLEVVPMVNLHFSLLPRWRGAAPVERALLAGDKVTGVCLMRVDVGLDTGDVFDVVEVPIDDETTAHQLRESLVVEGSRMMVRHLLNGFGAPRPQQGEPMYASKIDASELQIDWTSATTALRLIRLGGAFTFFRGRRMKIHAAHFDVPTSSSVPGMIEVIDGRVVAAAAEARIVIDSLQPEGKPRMDAASWANGAQLKPDEAFTRG